MLKAAVHWVLPEDALAHGLVGGFAGLVGGLLFGFWLTHTGMFPALASIVGSTSSTPGVAIHLASSIGIGASFGVLFARISRGTISSLLWGLVYGFLWWFLGPLSLMPLLMGMGLFWDAATISQSLPSLYGHLVFGGVMGVSYAVVVDDVLLVWGRDARRGPSFAR